MSVSPKDPAARGNGASSIDYSLSARRGFGASPMDRGDAVRSGLLEDLLPVVSNPAAVISPNSGLTTLGKAPSRYNKDRQVIGFPNWPEHKTTAAMVEAWKREPDYGICIQTRRLRALDIDVRDPQKAGEIVAAVYHHLKITLPKRYRANTGKCLLVFWLLADEQGDFHKRSFHVASGEAVEFLATGQQFVAVGTHPSGTRYQWGDLDCLPDANEIPTLTREIFACLWASLIAQFAMPDSATKGNGTVRHDVADHAIRNDLIAARFIDGGMVRGYRNDGGLDVQCPQEDLHSGDSGRTETTYWPAHTGGFPDGGFKCQHAHCANLKIADVRNVFGLPGGNQSSEPKRFDPLTVDEVLAQPYPTWWIKNVLPCAALVVIYGEASSGKSAFAYDVVASLVNGTPWCGHVVKQCRVFWIAAEGAGGHRKRTAALDKAYGLDRSRLLTLLDAPNLLEAEQAKELAATINARGGTDVIVIDTLAQVTPGANENGSEDMGLLIANCRVLHDLTGATIVLIHHAGKDLARGARGWSGLRAAVDAEIEVSRTGNDHLARITKMKDGDDRGRFAFTLSKTLLGVDDDGDEISSIVVEHVHRPIVVSVPQPKGANETAVYKSLIKAQRTADAGRVAIRALIDAAVQYMVRDLKTDPEGAKRDRRRQSARRAIDAMANRGVVIVQDDYVWSA